MPVRFYECHAGAAELLGERTDPSGTTVLWPATTWRCDRLQRRFVAIAGSARGVTTARTRSCARRFTLDTPARARVGTAATVRVIDRFNLGDSRVRVCVRGRCRPLAFPPAVTVRSLKVPAGEPGQLPVTLRTRYGTTRRAIAVGRRAPAGPPVPSVLATGDSTMTGVESFLADELADRADVISGVLPGGRLSGEENGWLKVAREQVARDHPDLVVLSIGANEGFSVDGRQCCYPAWVNAYAKRMRGVLRTYRQGRRAEVLVLTVHLPRFPERVPVMQAANAGIRRAAAGMRGIHVLPMDEIFTPDGYREAIPYRGRKVRVRSSDGIHLNVSGQAIAARLIADALAPLIRR